MKKAQKETKQDNELRPEYRFDYRKAKPNRFAAKLKKGGRLVLLEPEVAAAFPESKDVNAALKSVMKKKRKNKSGSAA